ncbi:hypothetical protein N9937_00375 [bacterium]|nr:hypothetical protein [bacterium]
MLMSRKVMKTQSGITSILDPNHPKVLARYPATVATTTSWADVSPNGYDFTIESGTMAIVDGTVRRNNAVIRNSNNFLDGLGDFEVLFIGNFGGSSGTTIDYHFTTIAGDAGNFYFYGQSGTRIRLAVSKSTTSYYIANSLPIVSGYYPLSFRREGQVVTLEHNGVIILSYDDPSMAGPIKTNTGSWALYSSRSDSNRAGTYPNLKDMVFLNELATPEERAEWFNDWVPYVP